VEKARSQLPSASVRAQLNLLRKALCEPVRLQIIKALGPGELCVGDLAAVIDRPLEATSQHLRVLRDLHAVAGSRRGVKMYYRLTADGRRRYAGILNTVERALQRNPDAGSEPSSRETVASSR
jgi:ArsR family transcriptional regulator